jgi:hypothetical protein
MLLVSSRRTINVRKRSTLPLISAPVESATLSREPARRQERKNKRGNVKGSFEEVIRQPLSGVGRAVRHSIRPPSDGAGNVDQRRSGGFQPPLD